MLMDVEIKRLKNDIMQSYLVDKLSVTRPDTDNHTTALEDSSLKFITLLPWVQLHLTKQSNKGSTPHKIKHVALGIARAIKECTWNILEGKLESRIDGVIT